MKLKCKQADPSAKLKYGGTLILVLVCLRTNFHMPVPSQHMQEPINYQKCIFFLGELLPLS